MLFWQHRRQGMLAVDGSLWFLVSSWQVMTDFVLDRQLCHIGYRHHALPYLMHLKSKAGLLSIVNILFILIIICLWSTILLKGSEIAHINVFILSQCSYFVLVSHLCSGLITGCLLKGYPQHSSGTSHIFCV